MRIVKAVQNLIESFERLPGIGPKTAQRLTFYLLHVPQSELDNFSASISNLKKQTVTCSVCNNIADSDPCSICSDLSRDQSIICVVEQPLDVLALEKIGSYRGVYHVLGGAISPLNNIGPDEIFISSLITRLKTGVISELIMALNPNMEGEATSMYIQREIDNHKASLKNVPIITRLAHGLPMGSDLEYADEITLSRALEGRRQL